MEDVLEDMSRKNASDDDEQEEEDAPLVFSKSWHGYFYVENKDGRSHHGIVKQIAQSYEEALGKSYVEVVMKCRSDQGWEPPYIRLDPEFVVLVPTFSHPVRMVDEIPNG